MGLPNWITAARITLTPIFVWLAYQEGAAAAVGAFAVFLIASLSDSLDGYLARRNEQVSRLGKFLDPLADKILVGAALWVLVGARAFPLWAAAVIAVREVAVQLLRVQIVRGGGDLPASNPARAKMVVQIVMVSWWLLPWGASTVAHWVLLAAALAMTLWTGAQYFVGALRVREVAR